MAVVLIAEDDTEIADILTQVVELSGHRAVIARDGVEALELARDRHPLIVLLDLHMPRLEGPDFLRLERYFAHSQTPVVIVITADHQPERLIRDLDVDCVLRKPFEIAELQALLERYGTRGYSPEGA